MSDVQTIYLSNLRLSFPHLAEMHSSAANAKPKYSADFLLDPAGPDGAKFFQIVNEVAVGKWAEHAAAVLQMINADRKVRGYGYGNEKVNKKTFQPYDGYLKPDGTPMLYISGNTYSLPQAIKANGSACDNPMEAQQLLRTMYGGCYVNAAFNIKAHDDENGRQIRCYLQAVQFAGDGQPFGEGESDASGMFGAVAAAPAAAPAPAGMPGMPAGMPQAAPAPAPQPAAGMPAAPFPGMPGVPDFMGGGQ